MTKKLMINFEDFAAKVEETGVTPGVVVAFPEGPTKYLDPDPNNWDWGVGVVTGVVWGTGRPYPLLKLAARNTPIELNEYVQVLDTVKILAEKAGDCNDRMGC